MSIRDILHGIRLPRHIGASTDRAPRSPYPALLLSAALVLCSACAPRQARIESEPNPGAEPGVGSAPSESAGDAALTADLQRLAAAQAAYEVDAGYYAARVGDLDFVATSGVRVSIIQGDRQGWSAVATSGDDECGMYHGEIRSPRGYLTEPDRVACR